MIRISTSFTPRRLSRFTGLASLGVDNLTKPAKVLPPVSRTNNAPLRKSVGPGAIVAPKTATETPK